MSIVQTTQSIHPYSSGEHVDIERDTAYLKTLRDRYNSKPQLFTTESAEKQYEPAGALTQTSGVEHFGNIKGSNEYSSIRLATVLGSPHFGDNYVEKWCALIGRETTRQGKGTDLSYSGAGSEIFNRMREQSVAQAIMRVGRDGDGATVYVHTSAIPDWIPVTRGPECCEVKRWTAKQRKIVKAVEGTTEVTTSQIHNQPNVDSSRQYVARTLNRLSERGYVEKEDLGGKYIWTDNTVSDIEFPVNVRLSISM
jgi:hypothetical protein